ncbi:glutaminyl-tRNA synthase (glutamine-hydrolyzing) subunit A [candidate division KSB1 bacterium 4484_219]|nr:MAG: glutaminyl-tRNA synthase (glutamine-hydrolyzing) subunit A [candidate division KSB1 bacterium 4484_219]
MELCDFPAHKLSKMIHNREISAQEILDSTLTRIEKVDGRPGSTKPYTQTSEDKEKVHAFITLLADDARKRAQEIDKSIKEGDEPGLLAGIPYTVKDIFCVKNTPSTAASKILANFVSPYTATPAKRLQNAGGILLGKVNLDEFTYGSSNESSAFLPFPRNPWNPDHVTGGSSGGSAAAVAAGEGALSLGTDTAGSIRQPAAFCGVTGLKPTYGRVSRYGLIAFGSSLDCPGPIAKNVTDVAMMLKVIAGADPHDSTAVNLPVDDYLQNLENNIRGMRIGLSPDYFRITFFDTDKEELIEAPINDEIKDIVYKAAGRLAEMGVDIIEDIPMPHNRYGIPVYFVISRVEAASNLHRYDGVKYGYRTPDQVKELKELYRKSRGQGFGLQPKLRILMGMYVSASQYSEQYYEKALRVRRLIRQDFEEIFDQNGKYKLDALLAPTTPTTAFKIGNIYGDSVLMQYSDQLTVAANHAGVPALSIPAGIDKKGLPIGIQFIGQDFSEGKLLQIGRAFEIATETDQWRSLKPLVLKNF